MKQKILILTLRPLHNGPRIIREINTFKSQYSIIAVGVTNPGIIGIRFYDITKVRRSIIDRSIRKFYQLFLNRMPRFALPVLKNFTSKIVGKERPDIIIIHDPEFLTYLFLLKRIYNFKIIYNAHEYHPLQFNGIGSKWLSAVNEYYDFLYRKYLHSVDLMVNVCESIAERCLREFGTTSIVIPNAAPYHESQDINKTISGPIKIIHHGAAIRSRGLEIMIEAIGMLEGRFQLDLMLVNSQPDYFNELKRKVEQMNNVSILSAVPFEHIISAISCYDIGLYVLQPHSFNQEVALPNKFFEFIQARLCVVTGPSVEMARIVRKYEVGLVCKDYSTETLVKTLESLTKEDVKRFNNNTELAAREISAEQFYSTYYNAIRKLVENAEYE